VTAEANTIIVARGCHASNIARPVIAFGCSIVTPDVYLRFAKRGIERAAEPDSAIYVHAGTNSIARSYNLLLDKALAHDDLEALVIVHADAELLDDDFCTRVRRALSDPEVAIVGSVGATGVHGLAWWDGEVTWNSAPYRPDEDDGFELTFGASGAGDPGRTGEVDTLYGVVLVMSPWAVANLRFDESIGILHGYDADICRQARAAGRKAVTADLRVAHHHSPDLVTDIEIWVAAQMRAAELWDSGPTPTPESDAGWKPRARAAEANAAAARLLAASKLLQADASSQRDARERDRILETPSWRLTEPLRRGNALLRRSRSRLAGRDDDRD
jgi:hypothetical protein